jgi:hypothetical protein
VDEVSFGIVDVCGQGVTVRVRLFSVHRLSEFLAAADRGPFTTLGPAGGGGHGPSAVIDREFVHRVKDDIGAVFVDKIDQRQQATARQVAFGALLELAAGIEEDQLAARSGRHRHAVRPAPDDCVSPTISLPEKFTRTQPGQVPAQCRRPPSGVKAGCSPPSPWPLRTRTWRPLRE